MRGTQAGRYTWTAWLCVACAGLVTPGGAAAQDTADAPASSRVTEAAAEEEEERDHDPMAGVGFGLKVGYLHYGKTEYGMISPASLSAELRARLPAKRKQPARGGAALSLSLYLGDGFGFGWDTDLYVMFDDDPVLGGYTGPALRLHIRRLYLSIGAGLRVGYLTDDALKLGLDLYGRIPIRLTYYVTDSLGLVFEFGFGYGGTGAKFKNAPQVEGLTATQQGQLDAALNDFSFEFAKAGTFDGSFGIRFP